MFKILDDLTILLTRGDVADIAVVAVTEDGLPYEFIPDDVVSIKVMIKKKCDDIILDKRVNVVDIVSEVCIHLDKEDTTIGDVINKPVDYWYEIELNPDTNPRTILGYDENGPKIFRLYPEGV